jgi:hypothetical protein
MELSENNPYAAGQEVIFADGARILQRDLTASPESAGDIFQNITEGDLSDSLAARLYANAAGNDAWKWWWVIADNTKTLENPLDLSAFVGKQIRVPDLFVSRLNNP